jgi:hypothetical protein
MLAFGTFGVSYFIRPFKPRDISAVMFMLATLTAGVSSTLAEENPAQINCRARSRSISRSAGNLRELTRPLLLRSQFVSAFRGQEP